MELYDCRYCNDTDKEFRGCDSKSKQPIRIDCYCGGNLECDVCKGKGRFHVYKCPKSISVEFKDGYLFRYFYHYRKTDCYPDGGCMLDQPMILIDVFNIMDAIIYNKEMKQLNSKVKR